MKEYIVDNLSLRGVQPDEDFPVERASSLAQLTVAPIEGEKKLAEFPGMSFHTILGDPFKRTPSEMEISIGGFVNDLSPFQSRFVKSAQKIKFYTGQVKDDPLAVENYPGAERLTINDTGRIGINSPNHKLRTTLDVREALPSGGFGTELPRPRTSSISITQPYYRDKRGSTPPEFGHLFFMMNVKEEGDEPFPYSLITSGNDGFIPDPYRDKRANLQFFTNTGSEEDSQLKKHLEINGIEDKTKIFTQLNLGSVPVYRDQAEAVDEGQLVNGDVYQDNFQNLKIVFIPKKQEPPKKSG